MIAVCLQVRLDSTRLPEKALMEIEDLTIIEHAMKALKEVKANLFLLLTTEECVNKLSPLAEKWGFKVFSGPKNDVLKRFVLAADKFGVQTIIRATGDNPLVSALVTNQVLEEHQQLKADYSNWTDAPLGTGVEVVETRVLKEADTLTDVKYDREHVTPWIYNNPHLYSLNIHQVPSNFIYNKKVSVDTIEDLNYMKKIFSSLYNGFPIEIEKLINYLKQE